MRDCREAAEDELNEQLGPLEAEGCEYIAENGRECIRAMFEIRKDCGVDLDAALADACDAVFVCPDGVPRIGVAVEDAARVVVDAAGDPDARAMGSSAPPPPPNDVRGANSELDSFDSFVRISE